MELFSPMGKRVNLINSNKILHVYKGQGVNNQNPVIDNQIRSIESKEFKIDKFPMKTSGIISYIRWAIRLRKYVVLNDIDLIHAHYSYSGFISLISKKPVICSLMGSDIFLQNKFILYFTKLCSKFFWKATIVKSKGMKNIIPNSKVIPNGVDRSVFKVKNRETAKKIVKFSGKKNIIFVACNPDSYVKNLSLAKEAISLLKDDEIKLHILSDLQAIELVDYYNAADLLLITSRSEGSPNVVKEAISCNCPVISTNVGDVKEIIKDIDSCYVVKSNPIDISEKIFKSLASKRNRIDHSINYLSSEKISKQLLSLYSKVLNY